MSGRGNGYYGYSMSNNARAAYSADEKPMSKWKKNDIVYGVLEINENLEEDLLKKLTFEQLKIFLNYTNSHHTSKFYNWTDFYELDFNYIEKSTNKQLLEMIEERRAYLEETKEERAIIRAKQKKEREERRIQKAKDLAEKKAAQDEYNRVYKELDYLLGVSRFKTMKSFVKSFLAGKVSEKLLEKYKAKYEALKEEEEKKRDLENEEFLIRILGYSPFLNSQNNKADVFSLHFEQKDKWQEVKKLKKIKKSAWLQYYLVGKDKMFKNKEELFLYIYEDNDLEAIKNIAIKMQEERKLAQESE